MSTENRQANNGKTKGILTALVIIVIVAGSVFVGINIMMYVQMNNAMKWSPDKEVTQEDKIRYSELAMLPEIADYVDRAAIRGMRDPEYCIETITFDTLEELYSILPFDSDEEREQAIASVGDALSELPEIPEAGEDFTAYSAGDLPFTDEDEDGKVISYYYGHDNYVIRTEEGYRFVFFVQTI